MSKSASAGSRLADRGKRLNSGRPLGAWRIPAAIAAACVVVAIVWAVVALTGDDQPVAAKTYTDAEYGFSFQYPAKWEATKRNGSAAQGGASISVVDPKGTKIRKVYLDSATVAVASGGTTPQKPPTDAGVAESVAQLKAQYPDAQIVDALHQTTVAGKSAWSWTLAYTQASVPLRVEFYWLIDGSTGYGINFKAADEHWAADRPVFDSILASFTVAK